MKQLYLVLVALAAGFAGGIAGARLTQLQARESTPRVIRARAFELVDEKDNVLSYWGIGQNEYVILAFGNHFSREMPAGKPESHPSLKQMQNQMLALGVQGDGPFLTLRGTDGTTRMRLYTDLWNKPSLMMDDEAGPRISLGIVRSDTPGPQDNDWALDFIPDSATIGMRVLKQNGRQYIKGFQWLKTNPVEYPPGQGQPAK